MSSNLLKLGLIKQDFKFVKTEIIFIIIRAEKVIITMETKEE